ncbi:MAG: ABC transporter permease [Kiritimatiellae bacterium]|nr:ABC transporter permease [Kiritimatiellia bacterium]
MKIPGGIGARVTGSVRQISHVLSLAGAVVWAALHPRYWPGTVRNVLARQVLFTGVDATRFIALSGMICGITVVMQAQVWLTRFGQTRMLGPILVALVVRELAPLLTNLIVLGRSGTAVASELASMRVSQQIRLLDSQGVDPFIYLVMPRAVGLAVSVFCLTIVFITVSLVTGFLTAVLAGAGQAGPMQFIQQVAQALQPVDVVVILGKTLAPGILMGVICCEAGLSVSRDLAEIPQATTLGQVRSLMAVFLAFLVVSVLVYV